MKIFISVLVAILSGCATVNKCGKSAELENSIYNPSSCQVYIRHTVYLDQVSSDTAEKIKQGDEVNLNWKPSKSSGTMFIPAHAEVTTDDRDGGK